MTAKSEGDKNSGYDKRFHENKKPKVSRGQKKKQ